MRMLRLEGREVSPELMDAPDLEESAHRQALAGLARINRVSNAASAMAGVISRKLRAVNIAKIKLLDVACGGGDVPVGVASLLRRDGISVELTLIDKSPTALAQAADRAWQAKVPCETVCGDILAGLPSQEFDVVTNSLFLHHLPERQTVAAMSQMIRAARRMVVVSDLRRSRLGWIVAWLGCHLLSRSRMVRHDGPASVAAAFTKRELAQLASDAGMNSVKIARQWPWRMMLTWEAPHA